MNAHPARSIVIGIMAYNEAANIRHTLQSLQAQTIGDRISRIVVVASGCTDDTCAIVSEMARDDARIVLVEEPVRAGKTVAINTFLQNIHEAIVVMPSADLVLERDTVEHLVEPLEDPAVGMVGSHPVPTNSRTTFVGFAVNLMWELHHRVAVRAPKMGELVAFRNELESLDPANLSDELSIETQVRAADLRIVYAPLARVYNHGPETLRDFVRQRERWCVANMQIEHDLHTPVSTMSAGNVLRAARDYVLETRPRLDWVLGAAAVELWCRLRALVLFRVMRRGDQYRMWEPIASTKAAAPRES